MYTIDYPAVAMNFGCLLICTVGVFVIAIWKKILGRTSRYAFAMYAALFLGLLSNTVGRIFQGDTGAYTHSILLVSNFCEYLGEQLLSLLFTFYVVHRIEMMGGEIGCRHKKAIIAYYSFSIFMLVVSQFTKLYYTVDNANIYHRNEGFIVFQIIAMGFLVIGLVVILKNRRIMPKSELAIMLTYIFIPAIAIIVQFMFYGFSFTLSAETFIITIMLLFILSGQVKNYYAREKELSDMQVKMMMSQIQPHFLYNALGAIEQLCIADPQAAKRATHDFSAFLRGNLNSLSTDKTISFEQELTHTKHYLAIEKQRFQQYLNVEYQIETVLFRLPALTLQPIVENAVRHGVTQKEEGGTITISARETDATILVTVTDDGIGFNPMAAPKEDGYSHMGIRNVRARLASMVNGTLEIQSTPGVGTVVTIMIPKEDE